MLFKNVNNALFKKLVQFNETVEKKGGGELAGWVNFYNRHTSKFTFALATADYLFSALVTIYFNSENYFIIYV